MRSCQGNSIFPVRFSKPAFPGFVRPCTFRSVILLPSVSARANSIGIRRAVAINRSSPWPERMRTIIRTNSTITGECRKQVRLWQAAFMMYFYANLKGFFTRAIFLVLQATMPKAYYKINEFRAVIVIYQMSVIFYYLYTPNGRKRKKVVI